MGNECNSARSRDPIDKHVFNPSISFNTCRSLMTKKPSSLYSCEVESNGIFVVAASFCPRWKVCENSNWCILKWHHTTKVKLLVIHISYLTQNHLCKTLNQTFWYLWQKAFSKIFAQLQQLCKLNILKTFWKFWWNMVTIYMPRSVKNWKSAIQHFKMVQYSNSTKMLFIIHFLKKLF